MRACEAYLSASCRHATHNLKLSRFRCEDRLALWKVGLRDALSAGIGARTPPRLTKAQALPGVKLIQDTS